MSKIAELLARQAELVAQIAAARAEESSAALDTIKKLVSEHGEAFASMVVETLAREYGFGKQFRVDRRGSGDKLTMQQPPKYRDPVSGLTAQSKGKKPEWLMAIPKDDWFKYEIEWQENQARQGQLPGTETPPADEKPVEDAPKGKGKRNGSTVTTIPPVGGAAKPA